MDKEKDGHEMTEEERNSHANEVADTLLTGPGGSPSQQHPCKGPPWWRSQRYVLAYIMFGGMMNFFFQRINFSIAIVCMVNHTAIRPHSSVLPSNDTLSLGPSHNLWTINQHDKFPGAIANMSSDSSSPYGWPASLSTLNSSSHVIGLGSLQTVTRNPIDGDRVPQVETGPSNQCHDRQADQSEHEEDGPFVWDKKTQGLLLGAIYWSYMTFCVPGNILVRSWQQKKVVLVSVTVMTVMTMTLHVGALWSPWAVFVIKLVQGVCTAVGMISAYGLWSRWAPPQERASLISLTFSGQMLGNALVFPLSALLCKYGFLGGWPSVFYVFGMFGAVWLVVFFLFTTETPEQHPYITEQEKAYIMSSLTYSSAGTLPKVPWCAILKSPAFWGITCCQFSFTWGLFLLLSTLPQYMYEVMKFDIKSNGAFSMLPYLTLMVTSQVAGQMSDFLIGRRLLRLIWARKLCCILANMPPAICLTAMSFLDCTQPGLAIVLLTLAVGATGFAFSAFLVNPYDIAPRFAPIIMALSNVVATIPGIVTPYLVAVLTPDQTREQWQVVFLITAGVYVAGTVCFCVLARGYIQPWAQEKKKSIILVA